MSDSITASIAKSFSNTPPVFGPPLDNTRPGSGTARSSTEFHDELVSAKQAAAWSPSMAAAAGRAAFSQVHQRNAGSDAFASLPPSFPEARSLFRHVDPNDAAHRLPHIETSVGGSHGTLVGSFRAHLRSTLLELRSCVKNPALLLERSDTVDRLWNIASNRVTRLGDVGDHRDLHDACCDFRSLSTQIAKNLFQTIEDNQSFSLFGKTFEHIEGCLDAFETSGHRSPQVLQESLGLLEDLLEEGLALAGRAPFWLKKREPVERREQVFFDIEAFLQRLHAWQSEIGRIQKIVFYDDFSNLMQVRIRPSLPWQASPTEPPKSKGAADGLRRVASTSAQSVVKPPPGIAISPAWEQLNGLIGLASVKQKIRQMVAEIVDAQQDDGPPAPKMRHMILVGNPGCGKTTVALIMASILRDLGILQSGQMVSADVTNLSSRWAGEAGKAAQSAIMRAHDGVLFIDEAHQLVSNGEGYNPGLDIMRKIYPELENRRGTFVTIFATYKQHLASFFALDFGLKRRIAYQIDFPDFTDDELASVLEKLVADDNKYVLENDSLASLVAEQIGLNRGSEGFGNAGDIRTAYESAQGCYALREYDRSDRKTRDRDFAGRRILRESDFSCLSGRLL